MRSLPVFSSLEPLEARIAPATIYVGGSLDKYTNAPFYSTDPAKAGLNYDGGDPFGANFVGGDHTYYIKLVAGDVVVDSTYQDQVIKVQSGTVIAFFTDTNDDKMYDSGELTGISLGANAKLVVNESVKGDIVSNFNDATGLIEKTSLIGSKQALSGLSINNAHAVLVGGKINQLAATDVKWVLAGTAADGVSYSFRTDDNHNPILVNQALSVGTLDKQAGSGISNVSLVQTDVIRAGNGGAGAAGGSLSNITLTNDSDGFLLQAGNGGAGNAAVPLGGAGGGVSRVRIQGTVDLTPDSDGINPADWRGNPDVHFYPIQVLGGTGGNGDVTGLVQGAGGAGGKLDSIYVGFELKAGMLAQSDHVLLDAVLLQGGDGGSGKTGGNGGNVANSKVVTATPNNIQGSAPHNEIQIVGGTGGEGSVAVAGGKAGAGGSLSNLAVSNLNTVAYDASVLLQAGSAGASHASGANGGSVSSVKLVSYNTKIFAGNGSDGGSLGPDHSFGIAAGAGGSVTSISLPINSEQIFPRTLEIGAGSGGDASAGKGGAGGRASNISMDFSDVTALSIFTGDGGKGSKGAGGNGGAASSIILKDGNVTNTLSGNFDLTTGKGGEGSLSGGSGGAISNVHLVADGLSFTVTSGDGGKGDAANGGNGGAISNSSFTSSDTSEINNFSGSVHSGKGGDGSGKTGSGGAGGNIIGVNAVVDLDSEVVAGPGGSGGEKAAGIGGSLRSVTVSGTWGDVLAQAGDAGISGTTAGAGGSITGSNLLGRHNVSLIAGSGSSGGVGGSISGCGYSNWSVGLAPLGVVTVFAGDGSGGASAAGSGGSISSLVGFVGDTGTTLIKAGDGATSTDAGMTKASPGGSISNLILNGGGSSFGAELRIAAGDAGNAPGAKTGAKGGDVKAVTLESLSSNAIFRYVAAGDGGNASADGGKGGLGGTISNVHVLGGVGYNGDIGVRSGEIFGYDTMGGLFAGKGGAGGTNGKAGLAGNVTNVSADAIAAIVAGKMVNGDTVEAANLANLVSNITLNPSESGEVVAPKLNNLPVDGSFGNWNAANILGAIVNPTASGANSFDGKFVDAETRDVGFEFLNHIATNTVTNAAFGIGDQITAQTDGFVAAVTFSAAKANHNNFAPQALLTVVNPKLAAGSLLPNGTTLSDGTVVPAGSINSLFIDNDNA
jgi:hypothetical protein